MRHSPDHWGSWYSVLILGDVPVELWLIKKGSSQTGRRGQTVDVFCSCQQLTVFLDDGVPGLATSSQGSPAHFSETNVTRRGQVMGEPSLGTFCIQVSLVPFLQLKASVLVLFCFCFVLS